ncbi:alkyl sulfatase dimerization domain-containing protein [Thermopolyspora sp. NPDC052614]|uniref:alkyl sulfatase dimerization domain-containing protein n=1 Tax=Thermopolyspora sp. NPDC052614 TaxID=3155682 RepID=UPI003429B6F9
MLDYAERVWQGVTSPGDVPLADLRAHGVHRVAENVVLWPASGNVYAIAGSGGLALFDPGNTIDPPALYTAIRDWSWVPVRYAILAKGRYEHASALQPFEEEDGPRPTVVAHENAAGRLARRARAAGYHSVVNQRRFGFARLSCPSAYRPADLTYREKLTLSLGDVILELRHARGETDDGTWAFLTESGVLLTGDLFTWGVPQAGDPHLAQRHPDEWAQDLRRMAALDAETLLPGQGPPIHGRERVRSALTDTADYLDSLIDQTLELMNAGARLDEALHTVRPPAALAERPYLRPWHDEPEFLVRTIWRLYGGWYDGNPAHLKPAPDARLATALAGLAGGAAAIAGGAVATAEAGDLRLACHLAELAAQADPDDHKIQEIRARTYAMRVRGELSSTARSVYAWAAAESRARASGVDLLDVYHEVCEGRDWWTPEPAADEAAREARTART